MVQCIGNLWKSCCLKGFLMRDWTLRKRRQAILFQRKTCDSFFTQTFFFEKKMACNVLATIVKRKIKSEVLNHLEIFGHNSEPGYSSGSNTRCFEFARQSCSDAPYEDLRIGFGTKQCAREFRESGAAAKGRELALKGHRERQLAFRAACATSTLMEIDWDRDDRGCRCCRIAHHWHTLDSNRLALSDWRVVIKRSKTGPPGFIAVCRWRCVTVLFADPSDSLCKAFIGPEDGFMWRRQVELQAKTNPTNGPEQLGLIQLDHANHIGSIV